MKQAYSATMTFKSVLTHYLTLSTPRGQRKTWHLKREAL